MIEIPIGKAIIAVEVIDRPTSAENVEARCGDCFFYNAYKNNCESVMIYADWSRKDDKNVIFKLVDINSHYIDGTIQKLEREAKNE